MIIIAFFVLISLSTTAYAQLNEPNYIDIGPARNPNSAQIGLNTGSSYDTNIQLVHAGWSGSHGILFNAYMSDSLVSGSLSALGNTKYANDVGNYSGGAGGIMFFGNGGTMDFFISPASTGQNTNIAWGTPKLSIRRSGNVGIGTENPTDRLTVNGTVKAKEVTVTENAGADFVFNKTYHLSSLQKLKHEIQDLKHLPGIPFRPGHETERSAGRPPPDQAATEGGRTNALYHPDE